ncbi:inorganic phosphate transporter [Trueperella bialowiezensis]|uniref:Low-affinity inorganic phosphate transporter 1 n=1 Tax=Trueperella bialowiezensis TaxID=312285 RepID=A0A448PFC4_9ACTO|nr:inorganic phosphate transporter [Trueperella bialowiezensis]VEI13608.1 Low-affinity inorganic phosphate transporter 1 [Trueperella bialowiezensis]
MDPVVALVCAVVVAALGYGFTNGFHDAADAVATSIATRALTPRIALALAASMNFLGALIGVGFTTAIGERLADVGFLTTPDEAAGPAVLLVLLAGLTGAIVWNVVTWWLGIPIASTHALVGGLVGACVGAAVLVHWDVVATRAALHILVVPLGSFLLAFLLMKLVTIGLARASHKPMMQHFRAIQSMSASVSAFGHGMFEAGKMMALMLVALWAGGYYAGETPTWVVVAAACAISLGTLAGGQRIIKTLGKKITPLDPAQGFAAQAVATTMVYASAVLLSAPLGTSQAATGAITGVGAAQRRSVVRWNTVGAIAFVWLLTIPAAGLISAAMYYGLTHVF